MTKNYNEITRDLSSALQQLRAMAPELMKGFADLSLAATKEAVLDKKTKELIALAIGVASRCDGCIGFHTQALVKLGVSKQEVLETLGVAIYMGGGPSLMYAAEAMIAYDQAFARYPS